MKPFPHHYTVSSSATPDGEVAVESDGLMPMQTLPPEQFGGPGDHWSPETLLVGALSSCFVLTFRAIARAGKLPWISLHCTVEAVLERDQGNSRFTRFVVTAQLVVPAGSDVDMADRALQRAEQGCLVSNSLTAARELKASVQVAA